MGRLRVAITLPQFRGEAETALAVARGAEEAGLDGVFVFDHLWPMGDPDGAVIHGPTLLAAVAAETSSIALGTLVARVGLVPDEVLVDSLLSIDAVSGGRLVAGLGVGDRLSRDENMAAGIAYPPLPERLAGLQRCLDALGQAGVRRWVGGRSGTLRRLARGADGWNGWGLTVEEFTQAVGGFAGSTPEGFELTWGGQVLVATEAPGLHPPNRDRSNRDRSNRDRSNRDGVVAGTPAQVADHVRALGHAGAAWVVCAPTGSSRPEEWPSALAAVAALAR